MRRAILATAATVAGLAALLDYRSSGAIGRSTTAVGTGAPASPAATTTTPTTTVPTGPSTGPAGSTSPATASPGPAQYTGIDVPYQYGDIQLHITVAGGRITAITVPQESATDPRSASINSQAVPILTQEALAAQNLHFDVVSGATFTSDAFAQSFQSALTQAGR